MAELKGSFPTTESFTFGHGRARYPKQWFDGQQWVLTPEAFGGADPVTRRTNLRARAKAMGLILQTGTDEDGNLRIQAITPDESPKNPIRAASKKPAKKTGKKRAKKG